MSAMTAQMMAKLRAPFPPEAIGKLPRSTCKDCSDSRYKVCDKHKRIYNCPECHGNHSVATMHLDFCGHADVTARLLEVDPAWSWEPMARDANGMPLVDNGGNLWILLTVGGVTRPGVGDGKSAKECIGDAIRNAAMRFGVALDLWAKGDRSWAHVPDETPEPQQAPSSIITVPGELTEEKAQEITANLLRQQIRDLAGNRAKQELVAIQWQEKHGYPLKDATDLAALRDLHDELRSVRAS